MRTRRGDLLEGDPAMKTRRRCVPYVIHGSLVPRCHVPRWPVPRWPVPWPVPRWPVPRWPVPRWPVPHGGRCATVVGATMADATVAGGTATPPAMTNVNLADAARKFPRSSPQDVAVSVAVVYYEDAMTVERSDCTAKPSPSSSVFRRGGSLIKASG